MRIGLVSVDSHNYINYALAKISAYHKSRGDSVEWADPMFGEYDKVYMSKIFTFTPDDTNCYNTKEVECGGTGYGDYTKVLPEEIDRLQPDYSLYPEIDDKTAYGFLTRGCPNRCPWCLVPMKEGNVKPYMTIDEISQNGKRNHLTLMDNNVLASDYGLEQIEIASKKGIYLDFDQGLDARLITNDIAKLLASCKWTNYIRVACDQKSQMKYVENALHLLRSYGYKKEIFVYCLLKDLEESYDRMKWIYQFKGDLTPHCQGYIDFSGKKKLPEWQQDMMRWANRRWFYKSCFFDEFEPRKGFKCKEYLK